MNAAERIDRAKWTWHGNRELVHASLRRSLWLTFRALFSKPPKPDNQECARAAAVPPPSGEKQ